MEKIVGIILVNYKDYAKRYLPACRDSLRAQNYPASNTKIYIVDNASSQDSTAYLSSTYPEAKILPREDGNYCAANNLGCAEAIKDGCDYLVVSNMDTEMESDWLSALVKAAELNQEAGIIQSKILLYPEDGNKKTAKINTLGNRLHFLGFGFTSFYNQPDREIAGYPEIRGYASGCCFLTNPEVFSAIGGWTEEYYMYHDDIEFSLKAKLAGYKVVLAPLSVIFHKYEFSRSVRMLYYMERNRYLLPLMFYPKRVLIFLAPAFIVMSLGMMLFAAINGWLGTWARSLAYFMNTASWRKIKESRKKIRQMSRLNFKSLAANFEGKIEFPEIDNFILRRLVNPILDFYWRLVKKIV